MAEEFDHLQCPICGSELVYSEGTHDLGCRNNPKPFEEPGRRREKALHESTVSYESPPIGADNSRAENTAISEGSYKSYRFCNAEHGSQGESPRICDLNRKTNGSFYEDVDKDGSDFCVFGLSFTESAKNGTLWSIRIVDGETNYAALMRLMQNVEKRVKTNQALAANVPNLPKKVQRSKVSKLAFRYNLEIEDLFSIKYSTETIERLAMFYNLTNKEVRHIKQTDILED